jgi:hypothetical protein
LNEKIHFGVTKNHKVEITHFTRRKFDQGMFLVSIS